MNPCSAKPATRDAPDGGFTLVEALVAFMIIAIVLTMGLKALTGGAAAARRGAIVAERGEEAASLIDGALADVRIAPGRHAGRFADGEPWLMEIADVTAALVPKSATPLLRVALSAGGSIQGPPMLVTLAFGQRR